MNKVIMIGRMASDTELRKTKDGKDFATFRIAVRRDFRNGDGGFDADFFAVCVWGPSAEFVHKYAPKGREVAVSGRLQNRTYDAQDGSKRYVTEIIADNVQLLGEKVESKPQKKPGAFVETNEPLPF